MKNYIQIAFLILIVLSIISCQNLKQKDTPLDLIEFGIEESQNDSLGVELKLDSFDDFKDLINRVNQIVCNDSLPKIVIKNKKKNKSVYLRNPCSENYGCILIRSRNSVDIINDTIFKHWEKYYPLDSLDNVLKRDLNNYGKNPFYSDHPEKLLIRVYYTKEGIKRLPKMLDKLTKTYSKLDSIHEIKIWLTNYYPFIPAPPPPSGEPEIVEEIELTETKTQ